MGNFTRRQLGALTLATAAVGPEAIAQGVSIEERVARVVARTFKVKRSEVRSAGRLLEDFRKDSLDCVELMFEVEDEFKVKMPMRIYINFVTVGDIVRYLEVNKGKSR